MLKYLNTAVTFAEIPNEVTLCINLTNCPNRCLNCHSPYLQRDIGDVLGYNTLKALIEKNKGITCICFMGGDSDPDQVALLAFKIKKEFPDLLVAWYSGKQELPKDFPIKWFNYIKVGPYIESLGSLDKKTTNQKFYRIQALKEVSEKGDRLYGLEDLTYLFWKR